MPRCRELVLLSLAVSAAAAAETINVPNFSFELPPVTRDEQNPFGALPYIDDWDETAIGPADEFDQNTGVFLNTDPQSPDHITNAHLDRLAFVSSLIGNDLRQELADNFEPGRHYRLTVAVATSSYFGVGADEELEVGLFYFDGGVEQTIASSFVAGSEVNATSLIDVSIVTPLVTVNDAWANQPIGILIRPSIADPDDTEGEGFWDVDYVRLKAFEPLVGDFDIDGDVDLEDFEIFRACSTGPATGSTPPGCEDADFDDDHDVDLDDFGVFQLNITGPE